MIGIVGATDFEMGKLLEELPVDKKETIGGFEFYFGKLFGQDVVAVKCGIGKVFAAAGCQTLLTNYKVERIINIGAAGGLTDGLSMGDIVLVEKAVQYDMDTTAFGDPLGMISGINKVFFDCSIYDGFYEKLLEKGIHTIKGNNATADIFCTKADVKNVLREKFSAASVDMEAGALAQICYINNVSLESVKIISDGANDNSGDDYNKYTGTVGERVMEILSYRFSL